MISNIDWSRERERGMNGSFEMSCLHINRLTLCEYVVYKRTTCSVLLLKIH